MIDPQLASFLEEGLSLFIGTRNAALEPEGARAAALKVDPDGRHLVAYVPEAAFSRIRPNTEENGYVAISVGRPVDDRACQVKGLFVSIRDATDEEKPAVLAQWDGFLGSLEKIGIPRAATSTWVTWPAVAIRLRATELFNQTPGPDAGAPIR
jgi:hypothetical protein